MFVCCTVSVSVQTIVSVHSVHHYMCACCTETVSVQTIVSVHSVHHYMCACCTVSVSVQTIVSDRSVGVHLFVALCFCIDHCQCSFSAHVLVGLRLFLYRPF